MNIEFFNFQQETTIVPFLKEFKKISFHSIFHASNNYDILYRTTIWTMIFERFNNIFSSFHELLSSDIPCTSSDILNIFHFPRINRTTNFNIHVSSHTYDLNYDISVFRVSIPFDLAANFSRFYLSHNFHFTFRYRDSCTMLEFSVSNDEVSIRRGTESAFSKTTPNSSSKRNWLNLTSVKSRFHSNFPRSSYRVFSVNRLINTREDVFEGDSVFETWKINDSIIWNEIRGTWDHWIEEINWTRVVCNNL